MNQSKTAGGGSPLAREFTKRLKQLGISRREFATLTGLSRQTLHNIEHWSSTDLRGQTFRQLDKGLNWPNGTAQALASGDLTVLASIDPTDPQALATQESAFRWRIVERIQRMPLADLERLVSMIARQGFGTRNGNHSVMLRLEQSQTEEEGL